MAFNPAPTNSKVGLFRSHRPGRRLHRLEVALLWTLGVQLCFLPWALGTMHPGSQWISVALGVLGLALALIPRDCAHEVRIEGEPVRLVGWRSLLGFPGFWMGLGLLGCIAIQAANPEWAYVQNTKVWWLVRLPDVSWLPSGIKAPFSKFNAWRDWLIGAAAWSTACSTWVGITRRKSLRIILAILVINGLAICALGMGQRLAGQLNGIWPLSTFSRSDLTFCFVYKNHAGAYFALMVFVALALMTWSHDHGTRTLMKSTPTGVLAFAALIFVGAVVFTLSRGAALLLAAFLVLFIIWFVLQRQKRRHAPGINRTTQTVIIAMFAIVLAVALRDFDFGTIANRWDSLIVGRTNEFSVRTRLLARAAAIEMLKQHWLRGVGAGGFRYLFPEYAKHYPQIYDNGNLFWEHAHCDWLEIPIELGLAGDLLLVAGAGWWLAVFIRHRCWSNSITIPLLFGCLQVLSHALFDFPFQCPAIFTTWCVLLVVAGKWVELAPAESNRSC